MTRSIDVESRAGVDIRPLMAGFPTGVGVVTSIDGAGHCRGMTCTSVVSVALDPPTVLVCLREASPTLHAVLETNGFALNLLRSDARAVAELFASGAPDRFTRVGWALDPGHTGPHLVEAAHTTADCQVVKTERFGDHRVVYARVLHITRRSDPQPLLYGLRRYADWPSVAVEGRSDV